MMLTALSIIQSVRRRLLLPVPTALVGVTDPDELQMLEIVYAVCEELRQARCWIQQKRLHSFTTVANQGSYQLPKDFYGALLGTQWNTDETNALVGPVSDSEFAYRVFGDDDSTYNFTYRLFGPDENPNSANGQFELNPTPTSAIDLSFYYLSRNLFMPKHWLPSTVYTSGTYVNANGNIYLCDTNGTSHASTAPTGQTQNISDGTTRWDYVSDPYETIIADTDLCLFDPDLVKLGLRAKWNEEHGGEYEMAKFEYETKISQAVSRMKGSSVGSLIRVSNNPRYRIPSRSWSI
jgi:hypothetical protein